MHVDLLTLLADNRIGREGARELGKVLCGNGCGLQKIVLHENPLGEEGVLSIKEGLETNTTLTELHLKGNDCGDELIRDCMLRVQYNKRYKGTEVEDNLSTQIPSGDLEDALLLRAAVASKCLCDQVADELRESVLDKIRGVYDAADARLEEVLRRGYPEDDICAADVADVCEGAVFFTLDWEGDLIAALGQALGKFVFADGRRQKDYSLRSRRFFSVERALFYAGREQAERILCWMKRNGVKLESKPPIKP